jgi:hypothetical protein
MIPDSRLSRPGVATANPGDRYASQEEVDKAIEALKDPDFVKLMIIARFFCRRRGLTPKEMEPEELLSEAIMKTLQMEKKWRRGVSIIKHLDRAMENISGHLVEERTRILSFPDGEPSEHKPKDDEVTERSAQDELISIEESQALLRQVFGDDEQAARVFWLRAEGFQAGQIMAKLDLDDQRYEAIARRIRRKVAVFLAEAAV